jgi:hypothetical protein
MTQCSITFNATIDFKKHKKLIKKAQKLKSEFDKTIQELKDLKLNVTFRVVDSSCGLSGSIRVKKEDLEKMG